jgi:hypothetical protein
MKTASWIIVRKSDGTAILETFSDAIARAINTEKYSAMPALEYLQNLNRSIKARSCL